MKTVDFNFVTKICPECIYDSFGLKCPYKSPGAIHWRSACDYFVNAHVAVQAYLWRQEEQVVK